MNNSNNSFLTGPFMPRTWMCSHDKIEESQTIMVGLPYDGTCSYRPGTRFAPEQIRTASYGVESYSPELDKDLDDIKFYDAGDLELKFGNREDSLAKIERVARECFSHNKKWLGIGGEHLISYPAIKACSEKFSDLTVIHFDAHADVTETYLDEKYSHATVMKRASDIITPENLIQIGIRSGTSEEFKWMKENNTLVKDKESLRNKISKIKNKPVFLSIDLDVLDPSIMSGTGTPEPGGMSFNELISWLNELKELNIVAADVVELSPDYDNSGVSTITAVKLIREVLLMMNSHS